MGEKRYYWIKLKEDFFQQVHIRRLRRIAGGDTYTIIYLKMMLLAMNKGGEIRFEVDTEKDFIENLSLSIDEQEDNVRVAINLLRVGKVVETVEEPSAIYLSEVADCIGSETDAAERMRKSRAKKLSNVTDVQQLCNSTVTKMQQPCNNVTLDIRDKIKDIDIRDKSTDVVTNVHQEHGQMSGQMSQDTKVAYASHIRMTEENYNLLLELVNGNKIFLKEIIYDCNEWRKDHKPKSKKPNDYLFVKNWLKKELDKVPTAKTVQEEQPVMSADEKRKAYLDSLPPEIRANLDQFK